PRDFESQIQRTFGRFAADHGRLFFAHAFDEMLQFEFERFVFRNGHGLAHNFFSGKFADNRCAAVSKGNKLPQLGTYPLIVASDAINETFLRVIIERDVTGLRTAAEDANLAHPVRADATGSEVSDATIRET